MMTRMGQMRTTNLFVTSGSLHLGLTSKYVVYSDIVMFSTELTFQVGMAFQIDLPILVLREAGVVADGILEKGSSAFYLPTFDLKQGAEPYLESDEWQHIFHRWSLQVQAYSKSKDIRPLPYEDLPHNRPWARTADSSIISQPHRHSPGTVYNRQHKEVNYSI